MHNRNLSEGCWGRGENTIQSALFLFPAPDNRRVTELEKQAEWELEKLNRPGNGSGKPSSKRRSDWHIIVGVVVGAAVGGTLGGVFSPLGVFIPFAGSLLADVFIGIVVGGAVGALFAWIIGLARRIADRDKPRGRT